MSGCVRRRGTTLGAAVAVRLELLLPPPRSSVKSRLVGRDEARHVYGARKMARTGGVTRRMSQARRSLPFIYLAKREDHVVRGLPTGCLQFLLLAGQDFAVLTTV